MSRIPANELPPHGDTRRYDTHGCRCTPCREAMRLKNQRTRAARRARLGLPPPVRGGYRGRRTPKPVPETPPTPSRLETVAEWLAKGNRITICPPAAATAEPLHTCLTPTEEEDDAYPD